MTDNQQQDQRKISKISKISGGSMDRKWFYLTVSDIAPAG
jgi:hypothetical protein